MSREGIVRYQTENSVWEVNWTLRCVRRVRGTNEATARTPADGTWKPARTIVDLPGDVGLWILWEGTQGTVTSHILAREEEVVEE